MVNAIATKLALEKHHCKDEHTSIPFSFIYHSLPFNFHLRSLSTQFFRPFLSLLPLSLSLSPFIKHVTYFSPLSPSVSFSPRLWADGLELKVEMKS